MDDLLRMLEGNDDERWLALYKMLNVDFNLIKSHIPKIIEILREKKLVRRIAFDLLLKISEEKPEILLDYVENLKKLIGTKYESVYASLILSNLALRYPDVIDDETIERIVGMLEHKGLKEHALSSLSKICLVKPEALADHIPRLIDLIMDKEFEVRWNSAKVLLNILSKKPELVIDYVEDIRKIAENVNLKPSIRVVAYVILNELNKK